MLLKAAKARLGDVIGVAEIQAQGQPNPQTLGTEMAENSHHSRRHGWEFPVLRAAIVLAIAFKILWVAQRRLLGIIRL